GYNKSVQPFCAITSSTQLQAVMIHPERLVTPVSLTVNFAGPLSLGEFTIEATPMRTNNSTQHWFIVQRQDGVVTTTASAFFALRKDTWAAQELAMPSAPSAETVEPVAARFSPRWVENYEI